MSFKLWFQCGPLSNNDDGYELIKQYNQLIKQKHHLEYLAYKHNRIGGHKYAKTRQEIQELMDEIDK